ncbi:hypothetical protein FHT86_007632 [Rhizobium sp. BK313]|uniref:hypothetical protein n=1 Tax=Rhizobium sp. BK313 TaxID=2587081 RepID=UPI00105B5566|nr:hypothetical protein [Rhizobium sp. BK313]MBB3459300.1 hypothetical protein [Rhizobium sp. BK313]
MAWHLTACKFQRVWLSHLREGRAKGAQKIAIDADILEHLFLVRRQDVEKKIGDGWRDHVATVPPSPMGSPFTI